jgi:hypothetical protein
MKIRHNRGITFWQNTAFKSLGNDNPEPNRKFAKWMMMGIHNKITTLNQFENFYSSLAVGSDDYVGVGFPTNGRNKLGALFLLGPLLVQ